jgi:hypothetical protein
MKIKIPPVQERLQLNFRRLGHVIFHNGSSRKSLRQDEETVGATSNDDANFPLEKKLYIRGMDSIEICNLLRSIVNLKKSRSEVDLLEQSSKRVEHNEVIDDALDQLTRDLLSEYCSRVKHQVGKWLAKSSCWGQPEKVFFTAENRLATNHPEDVMYIIQMQMSVAREHLPPKYRPTVMILMLKEIKKVLNRLAAAILRTEHNPHTIQILCAIISDCTCMHEQLDHISSEDFLCGSDIALSHKLKREMDHVLQKYLSVAVYSSDKLAGAIMRDVKSIVRKIHTRAWIQGNQTEVILSTLRDYFQDIKLWIPPFFFAKFIRQCLENLRHMYLRSFFSKRNYLQARRVNALTASALLQRDRLNITQFFSSEYMDELKQTGLRTIDDVHQRFEILRAMSNVLKAGSNAHDVLDDIKLIVDDLGLRHGKRAIVILAKKNGNRKNALNQWKCAVHCSLGNTVPDFHGDEKTYQNIFQRR